MLVERFTNEVLKKVDSAPSTGSLSAKATEFTDAGPPVAGRIFTIFYSVAFQLHGIFTPCGAILEGMKISLYRARQLSLALLVVAVVDHGHLHNDYSGAAPRSSGLLRLGRDVQRRWSGGETGGAARASKLGRRLLDA